MFCKAATYLQEMAKCNNQMKKSLCEFEVNKHKSAVIEFLSLCERFAILKNYILIGKGIYASRCKCALRIH